MFQKKSVVLTKEMVIACTFVRQALGGGPNSKKAPKIS